MYLKEVYMHTEFGHMHRACSPLSLGKCVAKTWAHIASPTTLSTPPTPPPFSLKHAVRNHNITASTPTLVKMNALTTCGGSGEERVGKKEKKDVGGEEEKERKKRRGSWCVQGDESVNSETHTPGKK